MRNTRPYDPDNKVICGKTLVDWENAIVYVHNKATPDDPPTHLHFTFDKCPNKHPIESVRCIAQWTTLGHSCKHRYAPGDHEFWRARDMAIKVVTTFRGRHLKKHGTAPDVLGLGCGLTQAAIRHATNTKNREIRDRRTGQLSLKLPLPCAS